MILYGQRYCVCKPDLSELHSRSIPTAGELSLRAGLVASSQLVKSTSSLPASSRALLPLCVAAVFIEKTENIELFLFIVFLPRGAIGSIGLPPIVYSPISCSPGRSPAAAAAAAALPCCPPDPPLLLLLEPPRVRILRHESRHSGRQTAMPTHTSVVVSST